MKDHRINDRVSFNPTPIIDLSGVSVELDGIKNYRERSNAENNDKLIRKFIKKLRKSEVLKEYVLTLRFIKKSQAEHEKKRKLEFIARKIKLFEEKNRFSNQKNQNY